MWEGKWHLVTTCHYSDWVEIDVLPNTLTATVVQLTKAHFARFGIPERLVTDNGPQFISSEYKQFASEYGFEHVTSSPYWPQEKWQGRSGCEDCQEGHSYTDRIQDKTQTKQASQLVQALISTGPSTDFTECTVHPNIVNKQQVSVTLDWYSYIVLPCRYETSIYPKFKCPFFLRVA